MQLVTGTELQQPSLFVEHSISDEFDSLGKYNEPYVSHDQACMTTKLLMFWRVFDSLEIAVLTGGIAEVAEALKKMGPMSPEEKKGAIIFLMVVFLWCTDRWQMGWFGFEIDEAMAQVIDSVDLASDYVVMTSDHATPVTFRDHSADPVPVQARRLCYGR
jgi:hypothetical protein